MFGAIRNVRGFVQGILRGASRLRQTATEVYWTLKTAGLDYLQSEFRADYEKYERQDFLTSEIGLLPTDQLIPGHLHEESVWNLTAKFKYDLEATYTDPEGNTETHYWSIIDDKRLTQAEISDQADSFAKDYAPDGFPIQADVSLVGSWTQPQRQT